MDTFPRGLIYRSPSWDKKKCLKDGTKWSGCKKGEQLKQFCWDQHWGPWASAHKGYLTQQGGEETNSACDTMLFQSSRRTSWPSATWEEHSKAGKNNAVIVSHAAVVFFSFFSFL